MIFRLFSYRLQSLSLSLFSRPQINQNMGKFNQILITGEEMRKNSGRVWSVLRAGLAPSYKTWPDSTKLTVRFKYLLISLKHFECKVYI